ncbi:MAG: 3-phosphoshikimate 1-carboxyvinyltransferase [Lachnospiraceae bacterium]|nr:3-phosphoshikimate 1-carboxyvinyltransferase [Lachnospiraceae bacterium]
MNVTIPNKKFSGTIEVPESKSYAHRWLIAQALAGEHSKVICKNNSRDIVATIRCLEAISGRGPVIGREICYMDCDESATTYRLILPIAAALGKCCEFTLRGNLADRPMEPLFKALKVHGVRREDAESGKVRIAGRLTGGTFIIPGNISSQFVSGLLMAAPLLSINSTIYVQGPLESSGYVDMTLSVLEQCGIEVTTEVNPTAGSSKNDFSHIYKVKGNQQYHLPEKVVLERDWSQAAFWLAAGALRIGPMVCPGMNIDSLQKDHQIVDVLRSFGAEIDVFRKNDIYGNPVPNEDVITVMGGNLHGISVDVADIPDLVPVIALVACKAKGITIIRNAGRLKLKETDRLKTVRDALRALGADIREFKDGLIVTGLITDEAKKESEMAQKKGSKPKRIDYVLKGGKVNSYGDHRITMMCSIASSIAFTPVQIDNAESVTKSYPGFFEDLVNLQK